MTTFNPRAELRETCPVCSNSGQFCWLCGGTGFVFRGIFDAASGIDAEPDKPTPYVFYEPSRHITPHMVALARLLRDDSNPDPLRELLELIDGGVP
jgi:hypothetical protein